MIWWKANRRSEFSFCKINGVLWGWHRNGIIGAMPTRCPTWGVPKCR